MKKVQTNSDVRELIEEKDGSKELNEKLQTIENNKKLIKDLKTQSDKLTNEVKSEIGLGKFETDIFTLDIIHVNGSMVVNTEALETLYPDIFNDKRIWKQNASYDKLTVKAKV